MNMLPESEPTLGCSFYQGRHERDVYDYTHSIQEYQSTTVRVPQTMAYGAYRLTSLSCYSGVAVLTSKIHLELWVSYVNSQIGKSIKMEKRQAYYKLGADMVYLRTA